MPRVPKRLCAVLAMVNTVSVRRSVENLCVYNTFVVDCLRGIEIVRIIGIIFYLNPLGDIYSKQASAITMKEL